MENLALERKVEVISSTPNERAYLESMMPEIRQEELTPISGCSICYHCASNDYLTGK